MRKALIPFLLALAIVAAAQEEAIVISAADLKDEYKAGRREANSKYRGQDLIVFGYFDRATDRLAYFKSDAYCSFSESRRHAFTSLEKGSYVVMAGVGSGHVFGDPSVRSCRIVGEDQGGYVAEGAGPTLWDSAPSITAKALQSAYDENEVKANRAFEGKRIVVTGSISDFNETMFGAIIVSLDVGQWLSTVDCEMAAGEEDLVIEMRKGQEVRLGGVGDGQVLGSPRLEGCRVLD